MKQFQFISALLLVSSIMTVDSIYAQSYGFGRLFTSPAERQHLEALRKSAMKPITQQQQKKAVAADDFGSDKITFNGVVYRAGKSTIWLNGVNIYASERDEHTTKYFQLDQHNINSDKASIFIPEINTELKVGQSYLIEDSSRSDLVENKLKSEENSGH